MSRSFHNCYRELILTGKSPLLIHEPLSWECLKWSLRDWLNIFRDELLRFRCGRKQCQESPVWESECEIVSTTFEDFIRFCDDENSTLNEWRYFDYKHLAECVDASEDCFKSLVWEAVGFPEKGAESSTLWIGSSGAHTPCHVDTYGCNVVVQVYGRKRWTLFPFSESANLRPTRVPYEESSIYSAINFACTSNLKGINFDDCYTVDLNPGDILFVPPKWWHYVENLTTAISINTWIPHVTDDLWRINEGLVRYFISSTLGNVSTDVRKKILNPNEHDIEESSKQLRILDFCKKRKRGTSPLSRGTVSIQDYEQEMNQAHDHRYTFLSRTYDFISNETRKHETSCTLDKTSEDVSGTSDEVRNLIAVINAFCHPDIICQVQNKFVNSWSIFNCLNNKEQGHFINQ